MKIVFLTTQSSIQSTVQGRVFPLANELQKTGHDVIVFLHKEKNVDNPAYVRITGSNPFERTADGKKRQGGLRLLVTMKLNAIRAAWGLISERPDYIILVKPLPENTLAMVLAKLFLWKTIVILDVDDFELFANKVSSLLQRAAIHVSERVATMLASQVVVATPFLYDHIRQLVAGTKEVTVIPTGLTVEAPLGSGGRTGNRESTILYLGSVSVTSGHRVDLLPEILQEVRSHVPDATLVVAGSGDNEQELKQQFHKLGLTSAVRFAGRFSLDQVPELLRHAAILIDPIDSSIVSRAKSSFRCALALATSTPVVTSSIGIRTELIPEALHTKFFAKPEDKASYAACIISLLHKPLSDAEKTMMHNQSQQYTWEHLSTVYNRFFV